MRDLSHLMHLLEMRIEQLHLHLRSVRAQTAEDRRTRALIKAMRTWQRRLHRFKTDTRRSPGMTVH